MNHDERFVLFGAWDEFSDGRDWLILNPTWERSNTTGRKSPAYSEARAYMALVEQEGYSLKIYPMTHSLRDPSDPDGVSVIAGFEPRVYPAELVVRDGQWYART